MTDTTLSIVAGGDVSERTLETAADAIQDTLGLTPDISPVRVPETEFEEAYDHGSGQYEAIEIADAVEERVEADRWLVVTSLDITHGRNCYVFGLAMLDGDRAVLSTNRLEAEDEAVFTDRIRKQAIKQVGRLFGARECDAERCVFQATPTVLDLDHSGDEPCQECRTQLEGIPTETESGAHNRDSKPPASAPDRVPDVSSAVKEQYGDTATDPDYGRPSHDLGILEHELASIGRFWGTILGFGISVVIGYVLLSTVGDLLFGTVTLSEPILFLLGLVNLWLAWLIFKWLRAATSTVLEHRQSVLVVPIFVVMTIWLLLSRLLTVPVWILDRIRGS